MATDLCSSEPPPVTSPRISFSHNLSQSDINHQRLLSRPAPSSSSVDFDFCIRQSNVDESSSAEELFSDGVILPIDPHLKHETPITVPPVPSLQADVIQSHAVKCDQDSNGTVVSNLSESRDQKQKSAKSSFWQVKRSSSLNCGSGYARTLCPIPLLSRSHSTGSASSPNKSQSSSKELHPNIKPHAQKKNSVSLAPIKQSNSPPGHQKIPSKKSGYGRIGNGSFHGNGNRARVNHVLNVSSGNLFGLGSIFSGNKEKNKKQ